MWAWAFKESVNIICWTLLAIHFNCWWLALCAALFVSSYSETKEKKPGSETEEEEFGK